MPTMIRTFEEAFDAAVAEAKEIMLERRDQYGTANISDQGIDGVITRIRHDKLSRVRQFIRRHQARDECIDRGMPPELVEEYFPDEEEDDLGAGLEDDLLDTINYAIIALLLYRGEWELPSRSARKRD